MGHIAGSEAIIDVDRGDARGTAIEHREQGSDSSEARAVADASGHRDDRLVDEATDDAGERPLHPRHNNQHPCLKELFTLIEKAMDACDPHIVETLRRAA